MFPSHGICSQVLPKGTNVQVCLSQIDLHCYSQVEKHEVVVVGHLFRLPFESGGLQVNHL